MTAGVAMLVFRRRIAAATIEANRDARQFAMRWWKAPRSEPALVLTLITMVGIGFVSFGLVVLLDGPTGWLFIALFSATGAALLITHLRAR